MLKETTSTAGSIPVRDTLFGDQPLNYWGTINSKELPWTLFKAAKENIDQGNNEAAVAVLKEIIAMPDLESRHYLQAFYFLNQLGITATGQITIFAVVAEVAIEDGVDLLAVYADHSARYYNYAGSAVIWDAEDNNIANKIDHIL